MHFGSIGTDPDGDYPVGHDATKGDLGSLDLIIDIGLPECSQVERTMFGPSLTANNGDSPTESVVVSLAEAPPTTLVSAPPNQPSSTLVSATTCPG